MDLMERTNERRRNFMKDRIEHKLDDAMKDKARLEESNELLRQELDREQHDREQMWSALEKGLRPQRSGFRRLVLLGAGVGAAYVYGAKAGRGRYDEIVAWWNRMRGRASGLQDEAQRRFSEMSGTGATSTDMTGMEMGGTGSAGRSTAASPPPSSSGGLRSTPSSRSTSKDATTGDTG